MNRKQLIADSALSLFATKGYEGTSTQLIARNAGVSEALIFKHFGNKEKLLEAIIKEGYKRIVLSNRGIFQNKGPNGILMTAIELPSKLVKEEPRFWGLQYRLLDMEVSLKQHQRFMQPLHALLLKTFQDLGYERPQQETGLLLLFIDAFWKQLIVHGQDSPELLDLQRFFKSKYPLPG